MIAYSQRFGDTHRVGDRNCDINLDSPPVGKPDLQRFGDTNCIGHRNCDADLDRVGKPNRQRHADRIDDRDGDSNADRDRYGNFNRNCYCQRDSDDDANRDRDRDASRNLERLGELDFRQVKVNATKKKNLKIKNKGKFPLQVIIGKLAPPFSVPDIGIFTLAKKKTHTVTVMFQPTVAGATPPQILIITSNDPHHPAHPENATGSGK